MCGMGYYKSHFIDKETEVEDAACVYSMYYTLYIIHTHTHIHTVCVYKYFCVSYSEEKSLLSTQQMCARGGSTHKL